MAVVAAMIAEPVWCVVTHGLDGTQKVYSVHLEPEEALEVVANLAVHDFHETWWTIRPHRLGEAIPT